MTISRSDAINNLLDELEMFKIPLNQYYEDPDPQGVIDDILTGKVNSLKAFCQILGWSELVAPLQDMTPFHGDAVSGLDLIKTFIIPEVRRLLSNSNVEASSSSIQWFWGILHARIRALAQPRFEAGFFGDAVEASFKEVNDTMKRIVIEVDGRELDGASLMTTALSVQNPIVRLSMLESETDRNIQQGYMQIFAGSMTGIRNPKAHGNLTPDSSKALHLIALASLLMFKIDQRVV